MHVVTVRRQREYGMPAVCCACGAPPGPDRLAVSGLNTGTPRTRPVEFHFPLCARCASAHRAVNRRRKAGLGASLALSALLCGAAFVIPSALQATSSSKLALFSEVLLILAVAAFIGGWVLRAFVVKTDASGEMYRRVANAVKVRRIDAVVTRSLDRRELVSFAFGNDDFGRLFRRMNTAVVLTEKPR